MPGEPFEERVHKLRLRVYRGPFQEAAEADELAGTLAVSEPQSHTSPVEQFDAVAHELLAPLARKELAV
jgi:hypothetical protein